MVFMNGSNHISIETLTKRIQFFSQTVNYLQDEEVLKTILEMMPKKKIVIIRRIVSYYKTNENSEYFSNFRSPTMTDKGVNRIIEEIVTASGDHSESFRIQATFAITGILGVFQRKDITDPSVISQLADYVQRVFG